ncbi:hypothetical protein I3760_03G016500 [Carya illinoinensis]|nr:hypothetical protein I3760_03G016500 [Carya illinoinensis]
MHCRLTYCHCYLMYDFEFLYDLALISEWPTFHSAVVRETQYLLFLFFFVGVTFCVTCSAVSILYITVDVTLCSAFWLEKGHYHYKHPFSCGQYSYFDEC